MDTAAAREDLAWIRAATDQSHQFLCGSWRHQVVWGVIGTLGLLGTWAAYQMSRPNLISIIWVVAIPGGWAWSIQAARSAERSASIRSVAARTFGGIWIATGVCVTLIAGLAVFAGAVDPRSLSGLIAILFGGGYFASGFVAGLKWLMAVAGAWWIGGAALLFWPGPNAILVLAGMTLLFELGPALRLRRIEQESRPPAGNHGAH